MFVFKVRAKETGAAVVAWKKADAALAASIEDVCMMHFPPP